MDFPYNNPVFHPGFDQSHTYPYAMPRRSNSMTDLTQVARGPHGDKSDTKPRLSKSEVEILERQFQEQHKPSSKTKRQLAERMGVEIARINVR
jgi:Homeodomain